MKLVTDNALLEERERERKEESLRERERERDYILYISMRERERKRGDSFHSKCRCSPTAQMVLPLSTAPCRSVIYSFYFLKKFHHPGPGP